MDARDDDRLIGEALEDSGEAFDELMRRHQSAVYRCAFAFTGSHDTAMDVTQTVFLKALTALSSFAGLSSFRTWVLRIAGNELLNGVRGRSRGLHEVLDAALDVPDPAPDAEAVALGREQMARLVTLIGALGETQRVALVLRHFGGCSIDEIARSLGSTPDVAKNALYRAHRRLHEAWTSPDDQRSVQEPRKPWKT